MLWCAQEKNCTSRGQITSYGLKRDSENALKVSDQEQNKRGNKQTNKKKHKSNKKTQRTAYKSVLKEGKVRNLNIPGLKIVECVQPSTNQVPEL